LFLKSRPPRRLWHLPPRCLTFKPWLLCSTVHLNTFAGSPTPGECRDRCALVRFAAGV